MAKGKTNKTKVSKQEDAFFVYEEEAKEKLATPPSYNNTSCYPKNTLYVYKDKSTTRVHYDPTSNDYVTVYINT